MLIQWLIALLIAMHHLLHHHLPPPPPPNAIEQHLLMINVHHSPLAVGPLGQEMCNKMPTELPTLLRRSNTVHSAM
jgi:hypothetical protein